MGGGIKTNENRIYVKLLTRHLILGFFPHQMPLDPRFARLQTDPRFRRPKQRNLKVEIDERFRGILESEEFVGSSKKREGKDSRLIAHLSRIIVDSPVKVESTRGASL